MLCYDMFEICFTLSVWGLILHKMIDRESLVRRHCPELHKIDLESPLTVGNGELAFTTDITGFQTLYGEYDIFPLCTMSQWGWHTAPQALKHTSDDIVMTCYNINGREYKYSSLPQPGNEDIYDLLRHNPHRLNLACISLLWDGRVIQSDDIKDARQRLDLYSGVLTSCFTLHGERVLVNTVCARKHDILGFLIDASASCFKRLSVCISFPYGSHLKNASDWESGALHTTEISVSGSGDYIIKRTLDNDKYSVLLSGIDEFKQNGTHKIEIKGNMFTIAFAQENPEKLTFTQVRDDSIAGWFDFWNKGGAVDFSAAKDPGANELERRVVLSQYLTAVQCSGSMPPQETGLSCNSWYGKFHLEMHILHAGWFPLWGHSDILMRSIPWYNSILGKAKENAARNDFSGVRWPKMTGPDGADSPSWIATLLIWQQPHILYMLELIRASLPESEKPGFTIEYSRLVEETALFMRSFMRINEQSGFYELPPPLIPAQEEHEPEAVLDPVFELSYWKFGLMLAGKWDSYPVRGRNVQNEKNGRPELHTNSLPVYDGLYPAHRNCFDTFTAYNRDHPSMLFAYGFIPNEEIDKRIMSDTVDKVLDCWDLSSMWGWDFALMAMTLARLGRPETAVDVLLMDTAKNSYTTSGNNYQRGRDDLPLYLPGNGSLLLALALMLKGYGDTRGSIGFPDNGMWDGIIAEGISPLPY